MEEGILRFAQATSRCLKLYFPNVVTLQVNGIQFRQSEAMVVLSQVSYDTTGGNQQTNFDCTLSYEADECETQQKIFSDNSKRQVGNRVFCQSVLILMEQNLDQLRKLKVFMDLSNFSKARVLVADQQCWYFINPSHSGHFAAGTSMSYHSEIVGKAKKNAPMRKWNLITVQVESEVEPKLKLDVIDEVD